MKGSAPRITLLGSNSGNNVGDAAILSAILDIFSIKLPGSEFYVPTVNPDFVNNRYGGRYKVRALNIMPWNGALRFIGIPTLRCLWKSDVALICDGIIFGKKLYNPAFNMLITLAPLAIFAKLLRCKLVCYCTGIGPFPNGQGSKLARFLIQSCDLVLMREGESAKLTKDIGVTHPVELTGDAAYLNPVSDLARALQICSEVGINPQRPLIGFNATGYINAWVQDGGSSSDPEVMTKNLESGIREAQKRVTGGFTPVIFSTHPMDLKITTELSRRLNAPLVSNSTYLSHDVQAVMRLCSLFVGMRFHSLVLSSAVGVPIVGLVYAPKVRGLMHSLETPEFAVELNQLSPETLASTIERAWNDRIRLKSVQQRIVERFKAGAERAADLVIKKIFPGRAQKAVPYHQPLAENSR
jgi:polysaccharide pyruvyl transferase WcaK-like protein